MTKKNISRLLTIAFLGVFFWYWYNNPNIFKPLSSVSIIVIITLAIGKSFYHLANGLFTKWTAELFTKQKFTIGEGYYIGVLTAIGNFFGPLLGGTSIRAVYLKKVYGLPYSKFTSTLFGYYLMLFFTTFLWGSLVVFLLPPSGQTRLLLIAFVLGALALMGIAFLKLPSRGKFRWLENNKVASKIIEILYEIQSGWHVILKNKKLLMKLFVLSIMSFIATVFVAIIEFKTLGITVSLPATGLYAVLITVSLLVSFTPGAIGIREAMLIALGASLSITNDQILQIAVLDRAVVFLLLLVMFSITRVKRVRKFFTKTDIEI